MEICPYHSPPDNSLMPPKTDAEIEGTSFTGIPSQVMQAVREIASGRGVYQRVVYGEAVTDLLRRVNAGEAIDWPHTRPGTGGRPVNARFEAETLEEMRATCERIGVRKVVFFLAALRDYLRANGYDPDI